MLRTAHSIGNCAQALDFADVQARPSLFRASASHREPPRRISVPSSIGADVTVWQVPHPGDNSGCDEVNVLTSEDWAEIGALRENGLRMRALRMRVFLRNKLSAAVDGTVEPNAWRFERSVYGKRQITDGLPQIEFSVSHTENVSLLAVSRHSRLGIDVEARAVDGWQEIAEELFSRKERAILNRAPAAERELAFLRIWTAKEAYAKLLGVGLAYDLPANDFGPGTHLASWVTDGPHGRVVVSLAVDRPVDVEQDTFNGRAADN